MLDHAVIRLPPGNTSQITQIMTISALKDRNHELRIYHTDHADHTDHTDHADRTDHADQERISPERSRA